MTDTTCQPFKPDTWPVDADGFAASLCTECGTPVRYGSRHSKCGREAMGLVAPAPTALLVRDLAATVCATPLQVCAALELLGFGQHSVNMAVTAEMAGAIERHFGPVAPAEPLYDGLTLDQVKERLAALGADDLRGLVVSLLIQQRIAERAFSAARLAA